jgi:DNA phosphorothioation-dependent restriction protein DptH
MKYVSKAIKNYIVDKVESQIKAINPGQKMIFMIQSLPEQLMLSVADSICSELMTQDKITIVLKIAKALTDKWTEESRNKARLADWTTELNNLACYRNVDADLDKYNIIILCGSDAVTDSASLADFNECSLKLVWEVGMEATFRGWIYDKLNKGGIDIHNASELNSFDTLLVPIMNQGRADLISISTWLDEFDLADRYSAMDVLGLMLDSFKCFGLPKFSSFAYTKKNKKFSPYVYKAIDFFAYTMFIDDNQRKKALKAIDGIAEAIETGDDTWAVIEEESIRGEYNSGKDFLYGLKNYIQTHDAADRQSLYNSDFVFILDKILKYKKKTDREKNSVKKLEGSPVETVLSAIWDSLYDLYRAKNISNYQDIARIEIRSEIYRHDMEWDDSEGDSADDVAELAREYLHRLIGGLDEFINKHITLRSEDELDVEILSNLDSGSISFRYSRTAISELVFAVHIYLREEGKPFSRRYAWKLPTNHSYRLATDLLKKACDSMDMPDQSFHLPMYSIPYYDELLNTSSDEELRKVFLHSLRDSRENNEFMINLLSGTWLEHNDALLPQYKELAGKYHLFMKVAKEQGLFTALFDPTKWDVMRMVYEEILERISSDELILKSPMAGMILRAFLIIRERKSGDGDAWFGEKYEQSGIISVLHPSLLEMLQSQAVYQVSCFNYAVKLEMDRDKRSDAFKKHVWQSYLDLSKIRTPLTCMMVDEDLKLDTNVVGYDLIHKIGSPLLGDDLQSTRLMLGISDDTEDDQSVITDSDMFLETRESKLLNNLLLDYFRLHPHARDGLNIAVYRNQDIQPIIAAIHSYLVKLSNPKEANYYAIKAEQDKTYTVSVSIFTDSADDSNIAKWIELWKERWEAAETERKFQMYRSCRFSIAHRLINQAEPNSFLRMINDNFSTDIAILYDFIGAGSGSNKFETVDSFDIRTHSLKYPVLEKAVATIDSPADKFKRFRIISNRQFNLSSKLASCMHALKSDHVQTGTVVMGTGDLKPWMNTLEAIHSKAEWVICIDPSVDDRLLRDSSKSEELQREIIGFGSGVGVSGEENFTISTEQFSLSDIEIRLRSSIRSLINDPTWTDDDYRAIAKGTINVAKELSGLSLVRATGAADQYIRDFMAYALARKILKTDETLLCDNLVSLDAYRHWFDFAESGTRPDLLWMKAKVNADKRIELSLHLIECKMGNKSEDLLLKAKKQINNGLKVLMPAFKPNFQESNQLDDDKPDRRYWWMQLHRLIAAKAKIDRYHYQEVISALERLAEGDYHISWNASVFAYWIDDNVTEFKKTGFWKVDGIEQETANVYTIGRKYIKEIAISNKDSLNPFEDINKHQSEDDENEMNNFEDVDTPSGSEDDDFDPSNNTFEWDDDEAEDPEEGDTVPDWETDKPHQPETPCKSDDVESDPQDERSGESEAEDDEPFEEPISIPDRILLGTTTGGKPVYWEFGHDGLANRHMVVFGTSGMGKTYAIQCILCELARKMQNGLVIDYTDGFIPSNIEVAARGFIPAAGQTFIYNEPLPINPFKAQVSEQDGMVFKDTSITIAKRVASIFKNVYDLGAQQLPFTIEVIQNGVDRYGDDFNLDKLQEMFLEYLEDPLYTKNTVQTTITKLRPFITSKPFLVDGKEIGWDDIFSDHEHRNRIFQFHKVDKHSCRAVIEFVLWDLYNYVSSYGGKHLPKVIVLDEVQNLDLGPDAPVAKYLTEGRKHGLALITATQTVKGVGGVSDAKVSRLFQAELKLFFKPTENEMKEHAQLLNNAIGDVSVKDWTSRLAKLQKGECWVLGRHLDDLSGDLRLRAQKVKISSLEERGFNG